MSISSRSHKSECKKKMHFQRPLSLSTADLRPVRDFMGNVGKERRYRWSSPSLFSGLISVSKGNTWGEIFCLQAGFVDISSHFTIQCYLFGLSTHRKDGNGSIAVVTEVPHLWLLRISMRTLAGLALRSFRSCVYQIFKNKMWWSY